MSELKDMDRFANEVAQWLIEKYGEYQDPMMMGGVLMRATMELYLSRLNEDDMHRLLDVVSESIPIIREQQSNRGQHLDSRNKILHLETISCTQFILHHFVDIVLQPRIF